MLFEQINSNYSTESLIYSVNLKVRLPAKQNDSMTSANSLNDSSKIQATKTSTENWRLLYNAFDTIEATLDEDDDHLKTFQINITLCFLVLVFITLIVSLTFLCFHCFCSKTKKVSKPSQLPYIINKTAQMPQQSTSNSTSTLDLEKKIYQWCEQKGINQCKYKNYSKSMWTIGNLTSSKTESNFLSSASTSDLNTGTQKARPQSTIIDLDEIYAKVNFSKKRKNRMSNNEAAIIAICRSKSFRSQNSTDDSISVIYDERTAL